MATWLTTAVDESCHTNGEFRGRRRSSVYPLTSVPRLFFPSQSNAVHQASENYQDESALEDEIELTPRDADPLTNTGNLFASSKLDSPAIEISPLSHAHVSDYASKLTVPRHHDSKGKTADYKEPPTPILGQESTPTTAVSSRKGSYDELISGTTRASTEPVDGGGTTRPFERMKWRLAAGFFAFFMCGWGDGITGTVLPLFMADFNINFTMSSLLYAANLMGDSPRGEYFEYIIAHKLKPKTKRLVSLFVYGGLVHGSFFVMMGLKTGYPLTFVAYVASAFSRGIVTAAMNLYFKTVLPQSIAYSYGVWGIGSLLSPLICQSLISAGIPWNQFYFGSLVLAAFNFGFLTVTFRPTINEWVKERRTGPKRAIVRRDSDNSTATILGQNTTNAVSPSTENTLVSNPHRSALRWALSLKMQWLFSLFIFLYYGWQVLFYETTTQAFIVSYLLKTRNANPNTVGYVSSGFWAGISIGRIAWGYYIFSFTQRKWLIHASITLGLVLELLIWFVNSNIGDAFSTGIIGLVFGPVYPAVLSLATALLPQEVHLVTMGLIGSAGSLGAAVFPFIAGVVSTSHGVQIVPRVSVGLAGIIFSMWFFFPSRPSSGN
ncbi:hypothetical protein AGABI1DRAFT_123756 [Agaricus bisporus var. burnettii JB137-S8]|uniref:Major facilitator superfamily (MFS) profile domain-containing protein n=1 Tax=Agaricus bisporus var. burnettii (strain JB137-S8 / ATCC MYA-4627 / FGSC 10392) TaxID=597362 RepID=K5X6B6_AGABU|nr:uncharacterized protein AGABI1DRAFT_123756 [Agaricus bisporus var. burnettii JB137-S8]EKM83426.1 hypothetical protein AGABI1DRAFT_123756 [Agaricus bisporus var. burnettii JB137-S8]